MPIKIQMRLAQSVLRTALLGACCGTLLACGSNGDTTSDEVPEPITDHALCIISADCPSGQHCDLGECVQSCNTEDPCEDSSLVCSPRARCLEEGEPEVEPPPATENRGAVFVTSPLVQLTEKDSEFEIGLSSTSSSRVQYRVTTQADFVSIEERRGSFTGETSLVFSVDADKYDPEADVQAIKIFTDLGPQTVQVVMNTGVTGKYLGALRYEANGLQLGEARVAVEVIDQGGELDVLFDPDVSLLFPAGDGGPVTGFGSYGEEAGASFTVNQRLSAGFGGDRNFFGRPIGRRISVDMTKNTSGGFSGTFTEKVYGLFDSPVELSGTISLRARPGESRPDFTLSDEGVMPSLEVPTLPNEDFFGAASASYAACPYVMNDISPSWSSDQDSLRAALATISSDYYALGKTMDNRVADGFTYSDLLAECEGELDSSSAPSPSSDADFKCAWRPALGCGLVYASGLPFGPGSADSVDEPEAFQDLYEQTLNPALLVAQDYATQALDHSLSLGGLTKERQAHTAAVQALAPTAKWVLHPQVLSYLADLSPELARGQEPGEAELGTHQQTYPAARALSKMFEVLAVVEGERARIETIDLAESSAELVKATQSRAVLGFLEAVILVETTRSWGITPDIIAADLSGFLNPLDSGFGALLEGARAFGIPEGFVPFVWRPEDVGRGATNFEQMLALTEDPRSTEKSLEDAYVQNARAYENSEQELRREAQTLRLTYDARIDEICGPDFDLSMIENESDWENCGAGDKGELGVALLDIQLADQRISASQSRLLGMQDKLEIDELALAEKQERRVETMTFMDSSNREMRARRLAEGAIDGAIKALEVASNASVWNGGAPLGMAVGAALLSADKALLAESRMALQDAQSMELMEQDADFEFIDGMANLQKQAIDICQLSVEMVEDGIAKQQALSRAANLLEQAKNQYALRGKAVAIAELDPSRDPAFRILRDAQALQLLDARARAQRQLFLAARALEYEINEPLSSLASAVLNARSSLGMQNLASCLSEIHTSYRLAYGAPQDYSTEVSVREMLGISGSRTDEATGQVLTAGEQFRLYTQTNDAFDEEGGLTIQFATNLQPDNGLWSSDVCADRISSIRVQLVGDRLGDNEARVNIALTGTAVLGRCDSDEVETWSMDDGTGHGAGVAVVQAGVNTFGETEANTSLFGQSVARASWEITIPNGDTAPSNEDIDLSKLEDIILKIEHEALPRRSSALSVDTSCLMSIN